MADDATAREEARKALKAFEEAERRVRAENEQIRQENQRRIQENMRKKP